MKTQFLPVLVLLTVVAPLAAQQREPKYQGKPVSYWVQHLQDQDYQKRNAAFTAVAAFGPRGKSAAIPVLVEMLDDLDPEYVRYAASCLEQLIPLPDSAIAALDQVVRSNKNTAVRRTVIRTLYMVGPGAAVASTTLGSLLRGTDREVAWAAANALGEFGPAAAITVPSLRQAFLQAADLDKEKAGAFRDIVVQALSRMGIDAVPALRDLLKSRDPGVAAALGEIGPNAKDAVSDLVQTLKTGSLDLRGDAAWALWRIEKHPAAIPALVKCVSELDFSDSPHANQDSRAFSSSQRLLNYLADIGPPAKEATAELRRQLAGPARYEAAWALWKIARDREAVSILTETLIDASMGYGVAAVNRTVHGRIKDIGKDALPALINLYRNIGKPLPSEYRDRVKDLVWEVIRGIDPAAAKKLKR